MTPSLRTFITGAVFSFVTVWSAQAQTMSVTPNPADSDELDEYASVTVSDPLEPMNRAVFKFNNGLYDYVLRPVGKGYVRVTPKPVRKGITNFFNNLRFPIRFVNSALQGKFQRAGLETGKFAVNTVAGIGGLIRVSDAVPALAAISEEDTGQTFGVWRVGKGPYLVLPFFGPSTVRDTTGMVGDHVLNPLNWNLKHNIDWYDWKVSTGVTVVNGVNSLPGAIAAYDALRKDALDPYVAVRSAYIQYREAAIQK
jgi:phospholipid-binding lipoprotein MlaA